MSPAPGSSHWAWSAIPAAVGAVVGFWAGQLQDLPVGVGLLVAVAAALVGLVLGRAALLATQRALAVPRRRRERRVERVQAQLRDLDFRVRVTPIVQRLRHLGGHGDHPADEPARPWHGFDAELADADARVLEPVRAALRAAGQPQLCDEIAVQGSDLDPTELSVELDRILGVVERWENGEPDQVPFEF